MDNNRAVSAVDQVTLTILVDNKADMIVESSETVKYFTDKPLLAEHGFSALVQPGDTGETILWDAGGSATALIENMQRMQLDAAAITKMALSHGHWDHYAAMTAVLDKIKPFPESREWDQGVNQSELTTWLEAARIPLIAHPAAFRERWWKKDNGTMVGPFRPPPDKRWSAAGAKIIHSKDPYELDPGCWTTGYIPRKSFEESGRSKKLLFRERAKFTPDDLDDDQAVVIHLKDKGLVVLSGCAHSGIVNTVEYARQFTGVDQVYAVLGGFHLARASDEEIEQTITYFKDLAPQFLAPSHCTGLKAISMFAREMPEAFIEGVVGMRYSFC